MNTKIAATLTILIFALSTVAIAVPPASAHFTLGQMTGTSRFRLQDFDPHVPGLVGYVFPGAGSAAWGGSPSSASPAPGYQSPYPGGNPAGAPSMSWYQLEDNAYAPFGAILTSTDDHANKGDLIFALNFTPPTSECDPGTGNGNGKPPQGGCPVGTIPVDFHSDVRFRRWYIYIPPEFGTIVRTQISTTITNAYSLISAGHASWNNPFGPGWTVVQIRGEDDWGTAGFAAVNNPNTVNHGSGPSGTSGDLRGVGQGPRRGYIAFTAARGYSEWYYVRVNGVTAPKIAGRYFFKYIMRPGGYNDQNGVPIPSSEYDGSGSSAGYLTYPADLNDCSGPNPNNLACVPVQNWPVLLVKGEIDPAIIDGVVRYAGTNTTLYGTALNVAGRVRAVGIATDPYTGQSTGRSVEARGYFNATAEGHYEIEGVAPGVYTIYAEAAGFPEQIIAQNVAILAGQSLHFDGLLNPGVVIHGQVFSKHNFGEETWTRVAPIWIEIWDTNDYTNPTHIVTMNPWNPLDTCDVINTPITPNVPVDPVTGASLCSTSVQLGTGHVPPFNVIGPYGTGRYDYAGLVNGARMPADYIEGATNPMTGNGMFPIRVAFDWEGGVQYYNNVANVGTPAQQACGTLQANTPGIPAGGVNFDSLAGFSDVCRMAMGVGPAEYWYVDPQGLYTNGGGSGSFIYQFGYKIGGAAIYGAPRDIDGHVPQALATWVNGMTPGRYYVRAYVNGYVQTALDGRTFQDYFFDVSKDEWAGDVTVPLDLLKTSYITKTVHFHDIPGSLIENPVQSTRTVVVEVWDVSSDLSAPQLAGLNMTVVNYLDSSVTLNVTGFGLYGFTPVVPNTCDGDSGCSNYGPGGAITGPHRVSEFGWWGPPYEDYGLRAGTYEIRTYVQGYIQQQFERVTIALSNSPADVSDHMWHGAKFNVTVFSTDWEQPRVERPWLYPGSGIYVYFTDSKGNVIDYDGIPVQGIGTTTAVGSQPFFEGNDIYAEPILNTGVWGDTGFCNKCHETVIQDSIDNGGPGSPVTGTAFDTETYTVTAYAYGYVQKKPFTVFAQKGNSTSDIKVNLVQGANITLNLKFKLENVFEPTFANMSMRMRVFNEKGQLVGVWETSPDEDEPGTGVRSVGANFNPTDPTTCAPWGILNCYAGAYARGSTDVRGLVLNYVPAGTTDLQVNLAGFEDAYADPAAKWITAGFNGPDGTPASIAPGGVDDPYGIDGYPNYQGSWTIEADSVWWYNAAALTCTPLPLASCEANYYPPVQGLLQGESFHTIPGHPNGLYGYVGNGLAANHLGPYAQRMVWTVPNAHLGGESSVTFELDQRSFIAGRLDAFTWSGELRPLSFAGITIAGADGFTNTAYTWDGQYETFLNPGDYNFTIYAWSPTGQGLKTLTAPVHLSDGQTAVGQNFGPLQRSNIPIPEFSGLAVVAFSALAASLYLLRRRRR